MFGHHTCIIWLFIWILVMVMTKPMLVDGTGAKNNNTYVNACRGRACYESKACYTKGDDCRCYGGYAGENCTDIDECRRSHRDICFHRGICTNTIGSFKCSCLDGWEGPRCHERLNTSADITCLPGYSGDKCDITACNHGYSTTTAETKEFIINSLTNYTCICDQGWTHTHPSDTCDKDIDECLNHPCQNNGTCQNTPGSYSCSCASSWTGENCSFYNACISNHCNNCMNNGTCILTNSTTIDDTAYKCMCYETWQGPCCEFDVNECDTNHIKIKCVHGQCSNTRGSYTCLCDNGWKDTDCSVSTTTTTISTAATTTPTTSTSTATTTITTTTNTPTTSTSTAAATTTTTTISTATTTPTTSTSTAATTITTTTNTPTTPTTTKTNLTTTTSAVVKQITNELNEQKASSGNSDTLVGASVGGVVLVAAVVAGVIFLVLKKKRNQIHVAIDHGLNPDEERPESQPWDENTEVRQDDLQDGNMIDGQDNLQDGDITEGQGKL